jgi:hypothetical protein
MEETHEPPSSTCPFGFEDFLGVVQSLRWGCIFNIILLYIF